MHKTKSKISFYYKCFKLHLKFMFSCFFMDIVVEGIENIPENENFIVASNHQSNIDPPLLTYVFPYEISIMAKKSLFSIPVLSWTLKKMRCIPIDRGKSLPKMFRRIIKILKDGRNILIFPEGTRSLDGKLRKAKNGVAFISKNSNKKIIPVAISGTRDVLPKNKFLPVPSKVIVKIGKPIDFNEMIFNENDNFNDILTLKIMKSIAEMLPEGYRGQYS